MAYAMLNQLTKAERTALYPKMVHESGRAAFEIGFWPFDGRHATRINAADVTCPILVIGASQDRITPASVVKQIAAKYPQATYHEYANHAHWIVSEANWQKVANDILVWIDQHV